MNHFLIVPGLGNSGPDHWQTHFENSTGSFHRIQQREWDAPDCKEWVETINQVVDQYEPLSVVLVGHSLGCVTIAHWATTYRKKIKAAFLVAPSDLESPVYTFPATGFDPIPTNKIDFKTMVVTSSNDHWVSLERAQLFANNWGSELINIGHAGHINAAAGYGAWPKGLELLHGLAR